MADCQYSYILTIIIKAKGKDFKIRVLISHFIFMRIKLS